MTPLAIEHIIPAGFVDGRATGNPPWGDGCQVGKPIELQDDVCNTYLSISYWVNIAYTSTIALPAETITKH